MVDTSDGLSGPASMMRASLVAVAAMTAAGAAALTMLPATQDTDVVRAPMAVGSPPPMEIGMNLGGMEYWSQEFPFADLVKSSSIKVITPTGWVDALGHVSLDRYDYPIGVPRGTRLVVMLKSGGGDRLPAGNYDCTISPGWSVKGSPAGRVSGGGQRFALAVGPAQAKARVSLELTPLAASADLKALSCRNRAVPAGQDFNPTFLAETRPFTVLRFMDWMSTNGQPPQDWAKRTTPQSFTQAGPNGVAVEHIVALANAQNADPWVNLPLEASDDYYRAFATYFRDNLRPDRRAYVEVSNEVWNTGFAQAKRATERGLQLYPGESPAAAGDRFYADRVRAVMAIWRDVFRGQEQRIVRVFATQAANPRRAVAALARQDTARSVDALAIAPYFGPAQGEPAAGVDPADYLARNGSMFVDRAIKHGVTARAVAAQFGLPLITYEGGPDYRTRRSRLIAAVDAAARDPRMYDFYTDFLRRWQREVGGLYVAFDNVSTWYGHRDYTGQPLADAPRMRALIDFMRAQRLNKGRAG